MNLLDLMVKIGVDDQASSKIGKIGEGIKTNLGSAAKAGAVAIAAAATAAAAGVVAIGKAALDSYASYEQLAGGVEKLFGDSAEQVKQYAQDAYKTSGMSANQYMEQATGFSAALITSLGGDTAEAAHLADVAMRSMSDNVNVFGSDMSSVQMAFQGFAKQNYTMLDNLKLGYGGTKEEMQRLIADAAAATDAQEKLGLSVDATSMSFDNIVKAIDVVQYKQGIWGTTANEAATTIEGSINMTKAAWMNFLTELGKDDADLGARIDELLESGMAAIDNIAPRIVMIVGNILDAIPQIIEKVSPYIDQIVSEIGAFLEEHAPEIQAAGEVMFDGLKQALAVAMGMLLQALIEGLGLLISHIPEFVGASLMASAQLGMALVQGFVNGLSPIMAEAEKMVTGVLDTIGSFFMGIFEAGVTLVTNFINGMAQMAQDIPRRFSEWIQAGVNAILSFLGSMLSAGVSLVSNLISGAASIASSIAGRFSSWISSGLNAVTSFFGGMLSAGMGLVNNLINGAASIGATIASRFTGWIQSAVNTVLDFGGQFYQAGLSIIKGLADGITAGISTAASAVSDGLSTIRSYLPFSPAKRGPFSGRGWTLYSGRSMMDALAEGITDNVSKAQAAMENAATVLSDVQFGTSATALDSPVPTYGEGAAGAAGVGELIEFLQAFLPVAIRDNAPSLTRQEFGRYVREAVA